MTPEIVIPIAGILAGLFTAGFMSWAVVAIARGPIGQALSRRIAGRRADPELGEEVYALREQVEHLQRQVAETQERLDFAERLLTRGDGGALSRGPA